MTTTLQKSLGGLTKTAQPIRDMDKRIGRAREAFNAKLERAQAEYVEAVERAVAAVRPTVPADDPVPVVEEIQHGA